MAQDLDQIVADVVRDDISTAAEAKLQELVDLLQPRVHRANQLSVGIPSDPIALGLAQFNERLSLIREYSNEVAGSLTIAIAERAKARARRDAAKEAYAEAVALKLEHDEDVAKATGQQAKLAVARNKLAREARVLAYCERILSVANSYHDAIKLIADTLKDTKNDTMAQLAVIKQQIALGEVSHRNFPIDHGGSRPETTSPLAAAEAALKHLPEGETQF